MANTFGNRPLLDPARLLAECLDRNLPTWWHGQVTVANCPPGREPGTAAFLMSYGDLRKLDAGADHTLNFSNGEKSLDLKKWTIREASAPISGNATNLSDETPYLVRAVDCRFHLRRSPFSQAYNVTTDGSTYVTATTTSGTPWTWALMFADLWAKLPGPPTAPTLPFTPHGTPQNFSWFGSPSAWDALNDLLDRLACIVCYDPLTDVFTVERLGTADAAAAAFEATAKRAGNLTWDSLPVAFPRSDAPESVKVVFRRYPAPSAGSDPTYSVTTAMSIAGSVAGTVVQIEDDLCAIGATGTPSNSSDIATRAAERVADFKRKLQGFDRRLVRQYRGLWKEATAAPGSTYAGLTFEDRGAGYATELKAEPDSRMQAFRPPHGEVDPLAGGGGSLTVKESDGSPSYSAITSLEFDQADGFSLSQPGAGRVKVDFSGGSGSYVVDNGNVALNTPVDLTSTSSGTWVDATSLITLTNGGTYYIQAHIDGSIALDPSTPVNSTILVTSRIVTSGGVQLFQGSTICFGTWMNQYTVGSGFVGGNYTLAAGTQIKLQYQKIETSSPVALAVTAELATTNLSYHWIGP
jgi:hypothetical protein